MNKKNNTTHNSSNDNLSLALEEQLLLKGLGRDVLIGELLVEAGMISKKDQDEVLRIQKQLQSRVYIL